MSHLSRSDGVPEWRDFRAFGELWGAVGAPVVGSFGAQAQVILHGGASHDFWECFRRWWAG
ncbi:MAG: hypothetical protein ACK542_10045, partial [Burkholderiales bacterium]